MAHGWIKTSLLDFQDKIVSIIFLGGCNMRCPWCHNPELVLNPDNTLIADNEIVSYISQHIHLYDGVVITGGEPTCYDGLLDLLQSLRKLDIEIKLDTNGRNSRIVKNLVSRGLIDYVAIDLKPSEDCIESAFWLQVNADLRAWLHANGVPYEVRLTMYKPYVEPNIYKIYDSLYSNENVYLQVLNTDCETLGEVSTDLYTTKDVKRIEKYLKTKIKNIAIRGDQNDQ